MPIDFEELAARGAIDAPIQRTTLREGKRGRRGPRQVRIWEAKARLPNGQQTKITCAYSVPLNLTTLRKQMRNSIERNKRLDEIRGDASDGAYYGIVYNPRKEAPLPKEPVKDPLAPLSEVSEPKPKYLGKYVQCPSCQQLRRVMQEVEDPWRMERVLGLECGHEIRKEEK